MAGESQTTVLRPFEIRLLVYLDQHGPSRRERIVWDLASPESKIGWHRERGKSLHSGGSSNGEALIMGAWAKRLIAMGFIRQVNSNNGGWFYLHHEVTQVGRQALRELSTA